MRDHNIESDTEDFFPSAKSIVIPPQVVGPASTQPLILDCRNAYDDTIYLSFRDSSNMLPTDTPVLWGGFMDSLINPITDIYIYATANKVIIPWVAEQFASPYSNRDIKVRIFGCGVYNNIYPAICLLGSSGDGDLGPNGEFVYVNCFGEKWDPYSVDISALGSVIEITRFNGSYLVTVLAGKLVTGVATKAQQAMPYSQVCEEFITPPHRVTLQNQNWIKPIMLSAAPFNKLQQPNQYADNTTNNDSFYYNMVFYVNDKNQLGPLELFDSPHVNIRWRFIGGDVSGGDGTNTNDQIILPNGVNRVTLSCNTQRIIFDDGSNDTDNTYRYDLSAPGAVYDLISDGTDYYLVNVRGNPTPNGRTSLSKVTTSNYLVGVHDRVVLLNANSMMGICLPDPTVVPGRELTFRVDSLNSSGDSYDSTFTTLLPIIKNNGVLGSNIPTLGLGSWCDMVSDGGHWIVVRQGT